MSSASAGPDFLCIGQQKAGTSWLYLQLKEHPDFCMPPLKELHYFDMPPGDRRNLRRMAPSIWDRLVRANDPRTTFGRTAKWLSKRPLNLDEYAALFDFTDGRLSGDITPAYSTLEEPLIAAIAARFPRLLVCLFVRDPVERFWSQVSMHVRKGRLDAAAVNDLAQIESFFFTPGVQGRSYPSRIAAKWRRHIPPERFGLFHFDDLGSDPVGQRSRILRFLGADPEKSSGPVSPLHNRSAHLEKQVMPEPVRARLIELFADELRTCAAELGGPAKSWPGKYGL